MSAFDEWIKSRGVPPDNIGMLMCGGVMRDSFDAGMTAAIEICKCFYSIEGIAQKCAAEIERARDE